MVVDSSELNSYVIESVIPFDNVRKKDEGRSNKKKEERKRKKELGRR